ncbi:MAG: hypothetical protein J6V66_04080 [Clostridia bacterium]|nr:hypothetical protein [Clostridia bacterium]
MGEIYQAPDRLLSLYDHFDEKMAKKDYLSALLTVDSMERAGATAPVVSSRRAKAYFEMGRYLQSAQEWLNYLASVTTASAYGKAYNGLGASFFKLGDSKLAGYYFNKQIVHDKKAFYDYSYVTAEFFEDMLSVDKNYYLAYPYSKADFKKVLERAEELLKGTDYLGAIKELEVVPEGSKDYHNALVTTSIARYFSGDTKQALVDIERAISIKPTVVAICNAISMFNAEKDIDTANKYASMLETATIENDEDEYKVAMVYCERGEDEKAFSHATKYLKTNPYDASMLMLYGMMSYNLDNFDLAEESFKKAYQISRAYPAKYYLKKLLEEPDPYRLDYAFDLQQKDRAKILKTIGELMQASGDERFVRQKEIYEYSDYAFSSNSYQLQSSLITLLGELATDTAVEIMKKAVLNLNVYDRIKAGVLGFLTADGFDGEVHGVFGNVYCKIRFYRADFVDESPIFAEAYAYVFAKLAPIENDMLPIKESAEFIYHTLKEKGLLEEVKDVRSLGAVMYELSKIAKIKSRREFASFFDANVREIKKIKSLVSCEN